MYVGDRVGAGVGCCMGGPQGGQNVQNPVLMTVVEKSEKNQNYQFCSKNRSQQVYSCPKIQEFLDMWTRNGQNEVLLVVAVLWG